MARKVYLHLGLMKTGTTLIQGNLFANKAELASRGLLVPGDKWADQVVAVIDVLKRTEVFRDRQAGAWSRMVEEVGAWDRDAVISMEFLGATGAQKVKRVVDSFEGAELELIFTGRDLSSVLPSMWQETLKNSQDWSWEEYLEGTRTKQGPGEQFWRQQDLARAIRIWGEAAPEAKITLVTVPPPSAGRDLLWRRFCEVVGVDPSGLTDATSANTSLGLESMLALRKINAALREAGLERQDYGSVKHVLARGIMGDRAGQERKLGLEVPEWLDAEWQAMRADLETLPITVVGDLDELAPRPVRGDSPSDVSDGAVLDAAVDALAGWIVHREKKEKREAAAKEEPRKQAAGRQGDAVRVGTKSGRPSRGVLKAGANKLLGRRPPKGRSHGQQGPRRAVRGTPGVTKSGEISVAVMTIARDEGANLARWVDYYSRQVGAENLIVFDDGSTDGSTDNLPCTVHRLPPVPEGVGFEFARMGLASGVAAGLLWMYDFVAFVDVDEFLIADPAKYQNLTEFLSDRRDATVVAPMALNVVHHTATEGDLDETKPVLGQRQFAKFVPLMCKPSIKSVPAAWSDASHGIEAPFEVDPELFMIHLKFADRRALIEAGNRRKAMVEHDGRAAKTSWSLGGDALADMLDEFARGPEPAAVQEFSAERVSLDEVVHEEQGGVFRTLREGQVQAMKQRPLWRIPARLEGLV